MSKGRHASGSSKTPTGLAVGILSVIVGAVVVPIALVNLFSYSPYENPGAGERGLWLGLLAAGAIGVPAAALALRAAVSALRSYAAWKRTLTPQQRTALAWAEVAVLFGAHLAWRHHNREQDAKLTASVMGEPAASETHPA